MKCTWNKQGQELLLDPRMGPPSQHEARAGIAARPQDVAGSGPPSLFEVSRGLATGLKVQRAHLFLEGMEILFSPTRSYDLALRGRSRVGTLRLSANMLVEDMTGHSEPNSSQEEPARGGYGVPRIFAPQRDDSRNITGTIGGPGSWRYRWPRDAITGYTWCQTNKGPLGEWLHRTRKIEDQGCHLCGDGSVESGAHLVFHCTGVGGRPAGFQDWGDLDRPVWQGEGEDRRDQVADFFGISTGYSEGDKHG